MFWFFFFKFKCQRCLLQESHHPPHTCHWLHWNETLCLPKFGRSLYTTNRAYVSSCPRTKALCLFVSFSTITQDVANSCCQIALRWTGTPDALRRFSLTFPLYRDRRSTGGNSFRVKAAYQKDYRTGQEPHILTPSTMQTSLCWILVTVSVWNLKTFLISDASISKPWPGTWPSLLFNNGWHWSQKSKWAGLCWNSDPATYGTSSCGFVDPNFVLSI